MSAVYMHILSFTPNCKDAHTVTHTYIGTHDHMYIIMLAHIHACTHTIYILSDCPVFSGTVPIFGSN